MTGMLRLRGIYRGSGVVLRHQSSVKQSEIEFVYCQFFSKKLSLRSVCWESWVFTSVPSMAQCLFTAEAFDFVLMVGDSDLK